jgi:hypothetical protein
MNIPQYGLTPPSLDKKLIPIKFLFIILNFVLLFSFCELLFVVAIMCEQKASPRVLLVVFQSFYLSFCGQIKQKYVVTIFDNIVATTTNILPF